MEDIERIRDIISAAKAGVAVADMDKNYTVFEIMTAMSYMSVDVVEFMIENKQTNSAAKFGGGTVLTIMELLQANAPDDYDKIMRLLNHREAVEQFKKFGYDL